MGLKQFDNLNTSYANLAALIGYLRAQNFSGSIHLALDQYEAEIFLQASGAALAFEIDRLSGVPTQDEGAMERALVHARESGGTITVFDGKTQPASLTDYAIESLGPSLADQIPAAAVPLKEQVDWDDLFRVSGDVVAAVERAAASVGSDFATHFRSACIAVGDDYSFLDPTASTFKYANGTITLNERPGAKVYVKGLSEVLRCLVNRLAIEKEEKRFRERVAVGLAIAARMRPLGDFTSQLDRIAGARVL